MENISKGPTFGDSVTIHTEGSMQDITVARLQSTRVQTPLSPSFKCNVLHESLSEDSQNIPCATPKRRGSWVISVYLWVWLNRSPIPVERRGVISSFKIISTCLTPRVKEERGVGVGTLCNKVTLTKLDKSEHVDIPRTAIYCNS
jgi:hypothetical protein